MEKKKKIIIIVAAILIIIGCIVVAVKGFNVSLYLKDHATLEFIFDEKFEKNDVKAACKEVFGKKKFAVRTVEVFDDSVYIISETITDEEKDALLDKLSNLYKEETETQELDTSDEAVVANMLTDATDGAVDAGTTIEYGAEDGVTTSEESKEKTLEEGVDYQIYHDSKVRLRDLLKPYILPTIISAVVIIICMAVRYKLLKSGNVIKKTLSIIGESIIFLLVLLSIVAICRIPVSAWILPVLMFFVLAYIIVRFEIEVRSKKVEDEE